MGVMMMESAEEITERLRKSMELSPIRTDENAAREFLSMLPMYDENGQLITDEQAQ